MAGARRAGAGVITAGPSSISLNCKEGSSETDVPESGGLSGIINRKAILHAIRKAPRNAVFYRFRRSLPCLRLA